MTDNGQRLLSAIFGIKQQSDVKPKPFYIYKSTIILKNGQKSNDTTRDHVIKKVMNMVIKKQKPESPFYLQDEHYLYTQFKILKDKASATTRSNTHQNKVHWEVQLEDGSGCQSPFNLTLTPCLRGSPIIDLASCDDDYRVKRALLSMLFDEIHGDDMSITGSDDPNACFYEFGGDACKRITILGPWVRHIWGLEVSVCLPSISPYAFEIHCVEHEEYFYSSLNLVDLLKRHFKCDVVSQLEPGQIKDVVELLRDVEVEIKSGEKINRENSDDVTVTHEVYPIEGVGKEPMCLEFFLYRSSEGEDKLVESISAIELFKQQFPNLELKYKNLPCIVVAGGKYLPMELCWIKPYQFMDLYAIQKLRVDEGVIWPTLAERSKIFANNCNLLYTNSSTLKKFGFTFELANPRQSCSYERP